LVKKIRTSLGIPVGTPLEYPWKAAEKLHMRVSSSLMFSHPSRVAYHYGAIRVEEAKHTRKNNIEHLRARVEIQHIFSGKEW
jgi:hypothetical protein